MCLEVLFGGSTQLFLRRTFSNQDVAVTAVDDAGIFKFSFISILWSFTLEKWQKIKTFILKSDLFVHDARCSLNSGETGSSSSLNICGSIFIKYIKYTFYDVFEVQWKHNYHLNKTSLWGINLTSSNNIKFLFFYLLDVIIINIYIYLYIYSIFISVYLLTKCIYFSYYFYYLSDIYRLYYYIKHDTLV